MAVSVEHWLTFRVKLLDDLDLHTVQLEPGDGEGEEVSRREQRSRAGESWGAEQERAERLVVGVRTQHGDTAP